MVCDKHVIKVRVRSQFLADCYYLELHECILALFSFFLEFLLPLAVLYNTCSDTDERGSQD